MKRMVRTPGVLASLIIAGVLGGCAEPTKPDAMTAEAVAPVHKSAATVSLAVSGGKETSSAGASQVSNQAFTDALRASIEKSGLFAKVTDNGARYRLTAFIGRVDQPMMGFSMTVKMEVSYALKDSQSGETVWSKTISSQHTATPGEAFAGVTRLRLATEGAAKENISQAIAALSAANL